MTGPLSLFDLSCQAFAPGMIAQRASSYVTGHLLMMDGGFTRW